MVVSKTGLINSLLVDDHSRRCACDVRHYDDELLPQSAARTGRRPRLIDGANQWQICWQVIVPLSKASIATITLFCIVNHWNSWFDGMLYFNTSTGQPLATYLHNLVVNSSLML